MPRFGELVEKGVRGDLRSLIPPVTGAAWLSMATGLNPGKTGVIDFFKHVGGFVLKPVSSADYRGKSVWDFLSALGYRVAVLDYPMLFPAYPVNGIMVSSWGGEVSTYPESLLDEVKGVAGGEYNIFVDYHLEKYNDIELFLDDLSEAVERKLRVSRRFMKKGWDLFIDVFSFTDWLQHRMWHYIDSSHPMYPSEEEASKYRKKFAEYWQALDEYIGEVDEAYDNVVVVSDHGFGPQWGVFNLARWLIRHGFMRTRKSFVESLIKVVKYLRIHKLIPRRLLKRALERGLSFSSNLSLLYNIESSKVLAPDYTIPFGALHVNSGCSDKVLEKVVEALKNIGNELGKRLVVDIWFSKDIYRGNKLNLLPDVIFTVNNWSCVVVKDPHREFIYLEAPYSPRHTGSHRLHGIFIAKGRDFKKGLDVGEVSILDIVPTILYMFNASIPKAIDGQVLREIFTWGTAREPRYVSNLYYKVRLRIKMSRETGEIDNCI